MKYIVCLSGGESSARAAIATVKRYGKENVILLNHDLSEEVEDKDIKRFKNELADYLGIKITYANMKDYNTLTPIRVCKKLGGFKFGNGSALCTTYLKTKPFMKWLKDNYPISKKQLREGAFREDIRIIYGFDRNEISRIQRRIGAMIGQGYKCDFPLAFWDRTLENTEEIGIPRPNVYELFRHANCKGCLKAGKQQWYLTYCLYPELWKEAVETEKEIGYSILKDTFLEELEPKFARMKCKGIIPSEQMKSQKFWSEVKKALPEDGQLSFLPCECAI